LAEPIPPRVEEAGARLLDAAYKVHRNLGPGLLESVYEACVCHELAKMGVTFLRQVCLPLYYDGLEIETGLRFDLLVDGLVIGELKSKESLLPIHEAQTLTYLKLTKKRLGLLINLNVILLKDGIRRFVL
jgi:GxxExxY protein